MKRIIALLAVVLLSTAVEAQESRVYTRPAPLSREALDRLHLKQAWRAIVPVSERRDGIFSVQLLGDQIIVQTRAGVVVALNAADGTTQWKKSVGIAYRVAHPIGSNSECLFVTRGTYLHALSRKSGTQMWEYDLPGSPSSPPAADEESVYISTGLGRLQVYDLPRKRADKPGEAPAETNERKPLEAKGPSSAYGVRGMSQTAVGPLSSARTTGMGRIAGPQPELHWEFRADARIEQAPILTDNLMVVAGTDGTFLVSPKFQRTIPFQFNAATGLAAPPGSYCWRTEDGSMEDNVFIAAQDFNRFCLDVTRGKILWRFNGAPPIIATRRYRRGVYLVADRAACIASTAPPGRPCGETPSDQYLASTRSSSTPRTAAADSSCSTTRGTEQASLDTSATPFHQQRAHRPHLPCQHGRPLICLHDRDNRSRW